MDERKPKRRLKNMKINEFALIGPGGKVVLWRRNPFAELRTLAERKLKKAERRLVELLIENDGAIALEALAADEVIDWKGSLSKEMNVTDAFKSLQRRVNKKLADAGLAWKVKRHNHQAKLTRVEPANSHTS